MADERPASILDRLAQARGLLDGIEAELKSTQHRSAPALSPEDRSSPLHERLRAVELQLGQTELELDRAQKRSVESEQASQDALREVQRLAYQDPLTGLANLNLLRQHLNSVLSRVTRDGTAVGLLMLDVDRFSLVNQALDQKAGDELLLRLAERLQQLLGGEALAIGRKGGDEFVLVVEAGDPEAAPARCEDLAGRLLEALQAPFTVRSQKLFAQGSLGISLLPGDAKNLDQLLEHAGSALAQAKTLGRGRYEFYTADLEREQRRRAQLNLQLPLALSSGELLLEYLPTIAVDARGVGRLVGAEALLRWHHRLEGVLGPHEFLPAAEASGLIVTIGHWILSEVFRQLRNWRQAGIQLVGTVNLSARQLLEADLVEVLESLLQEAGAAPEWICLDIPEGFEGSHSGSLDEAVDQLRALGFGVALDNYGVGASSLSRLLRVGSLKLSPEIARHCPQDAWSGQLCLAGIRVAQSLGLEPAAVGVEGLEQARFFVKNGCLKLQGYHFSKPLRADDLTELALSEQTWKL